MAGELRAVAYPPLGGYYSAGLGACRCAKALRRTVSEYVLNNVYVATGGVAWAPTIQFVRSVMGLDRIQKLPSVDAD